MPRLQLESQLRSAQAVRRAVPHQDGRPGHDPRRPADVDELVAADHPVGAMVHIDAVGVVGGRGAGVLEQAVLHGRSINAIGGDAAAIQDRVALEQLLAGVEEAHVVAEDALAAIAAVQLQGGVVDIADRKVGDGHVLGIVDLDVEGAVRAVVGHAAAIDDHVIAVAGGSAQGDMVHPSIDLEVVAAQVVGAGREHDGGVGLQLRERRLQVVVVGDVHHRAGGGRQAGNGLVERASGAGQAQQQEQGSDCGQGHRRQGQAGPER